MTSANMADYESPLLQAVVDLDPCYDRDPHHPACNLPSMDASPAFTDWLGRPITVDSGALGGWKCSSYLIGAYGLSTLGTMGILSNLVVFLVRQWGWSNAAGASTVSNLTGTIYLSAFLAGPVADAYIGRLWTSGIFQSLTAMCLASASCILWVVSSGSSTTEKRTAFIVALYMYTIIMGPILPSLTTIGADQLLTSEQKELYFKIFSISYTLAQLLATTVVTYVDESGRWVLGFWLCTIAAGCAGALTWIVAPRCRAYKASGNALVQIVQVLVAAWRRRSLPLYSGTRLNGCHGTPFLTSCSCRIPHTNSLNFLDKAAVLSATEPKLNESNPWNICTIAQVEELKSLLRVIPVGICFMFLPATSALVVTLFEEQALVMDRQLAPWLIMPAASLNLFFIAGSLFVGILNALGVAQWIGLLVGRPWCRYRWSLTSLQMQGVGIMLCILAMVTAAVVESRRLSTVSKAGTMSVLWLIPQTFLVGTSSYISVASSCDFFYRETSEGMRMTSSCILALFNGFGNYTTSLLVALITAVTTRGGQKGWISSNLNEGHLDYFYWLFASMLGIILLVHLAYSRFYIHVKKLHTIYPC